MGLTTWKDAPDCKIQKSDVVIAKNCLSEFELRQLNRMVTAYLDFAESVAQTKIPLTMADLEKRLNSFIEMSNMGFCKMRVKFLTKSQNFMQKRSLKNTE